MSSQYSDDNGEEEQQIVENKRHPLRDLGNMGKIYLSDSWHIYSSPGRINRHDAYWLAAFTATAGILYAYDQDIYDRLKRNEDDRLYRPFRKIGKTFEPIGMMGNTNKYYFGGLAAGYIFKIRPLMEISAQILESHFIAGGVKNVANIVVGRTRPHEGKGPRYFEFNKGTSFPSGHTSSIFQVATVLSHHLRFRPATIILYGIATSVAFQRVTSDSHWPSDVFIAAVYGTAVSRAVIRLHENRKAKLTTVPLIKGEAIGFISSSEIAPEGKPYLWLAELHVCPASGEAKNRIDLR
jgi:undecaprenyl-diphosphatase